MKATRDAFGHALHDLRNEDFIVLGADLSSATKTNLFCAECPYRYIECGISEMNMIGVAAGLASTGEKVFISSFASFLTGRYDQIRCSISFPNLPVIIVGTHAGLSPSLDGPTQSGFEDLALMGSLPNMSVIQPASYNEAYDIVAELIQKPLQEFNGPVYLRLGRQPVPVTCPDDFINTQTNILVINSGCLFPQAYNFAKENNYSFLNVSYLNHDRFQPKNLFKFIDRATDIYVVEDHSCRGGVTDFIRRVSSFFGCTPNIYSYGIDLTKFPSSGKPEDVYEKYHEGFRIGDLKW